MSDFAGMEPRDVQGTVVTVKLDRQFGFLIPASPIRAARGPGYHRPEVFFHAQACSGDLPFDRTLQERFVEFELIDTPRGPKAVNLRPAR